MITAVPGPLISQPEQWVLVFDRKATSRFMSFMALGEYKHVRAYGYVPFLHVWLFVDPDWRGIEVLVTADGEPMRRVLDHWLKYGEPDLVLMPRRPHGGRWPLFGWCVPTIKRLVGLPGSALRPDSLHRHCLRNGGRQFEHGRGRRQQLHG